MTESLEGRIGMIVNYRDDMPEANNTILNKVHDFGLKTCQVCCWNPNLLTDELAESLKNQIKKNGVQPSALWAGYRGQTCWNFTQGPLTLGIVPASLRAGRIEDLKHGARFAKAAGLRAIITHCGFLPENMTDYNYKPVLEALKEVAEYSASLGIGFWFETGQETPVVLLRYLEAIGTDNVGINLDPANLLMYGKGNPLDALEVFGKFVRNVHVKDGMPPTDGDELGREVQVGKGRTNYPAFVKRLKEIGFDGEFIIEREIPEGEEQARDINETIANLKAWWNA